MGKGTNVFALEVLYGGVVVADAWSVVGLADANMLCLLLTVDGYVPNGCVGCS